MSPFFFTGTARKYSGPKPKPFTSEGNLRGGLGSEPFLRLHQHDGVGMDVRTSGHTPGLTNFRIWKSLYLNPLEHFRLVEKNRGCEPRVKKLQLTCADRADLPTDLPVI